MTDASFILNTQMLLSGPHSQISQPSPRIPVRKSKPRSRRWFERPQVTHMSPVSTPAPRVTDHFPVGAAKKASKSAPSAVSQNTPSKSVDRRRADDFTLPPGKISAKEATAAPNDRFQLPHSAAQQRPSSRAEQPPSPAPPASPLRQPSGEPFAMQLQHVEELPRSSGYRHPTDEPCGRRISATEAANPKSAAKPDKAKGSKTKTTVKKGNRRKARDPSPSPPLILKDPEDGEWDEHGLSWKAPPAPATPPVSQVLALQQEASKYEERRNGNDVPSELEDDEQLYQDIGEEYDRELFEGDDPMLLPNSGSMSRTHSDLDYAQQAYEPMMFPEDDVIPASQVGAYLDADDFDEGSLAEYDVFDQGSALLQGHHDGETEVGSPLVEVSHDPRLEETHSKLTSNSHATHREPKPKGRQPLEPLPSLDQPGQISAIALHSYLDVLSNSELDYPDQMPTQLNSPPSSPPAAPKGTKGPGTWQDDPSTSSAGGLSLHASRHLSERSSDLRPAPVPGRSPAERKKRKTVKTYSKKKPYIRQEHRYDQATEEPLFSQTVYNPQPRRTTRSQTQQVGKPAVTEPTEPELTVEPIDRYASEGESELEAQVPVPVKRKKRAPRQTKNRKRAQRQKPNIRTIESPVPDDFQPITQLFTIQQDEYESSGSESDRLIEHHQPSKRSRAGKQKGRHRRSQLNESTQQVPMLRMQENAEDNGENLDRYRTRLNQASWRKNRIVIAPPRRKRKTLSFAHPADLAVGRAIERIPFEDVKKMYHPSQPGRDVSNAQELIRFGRIEQRNQELAAFRKRNTSKKRPPTPDRAYEADEIDEAVEQFAPSASQPRHPPVRGHVVPPAPHRLTFTNANPLARRPPVATVAAFQEQVVSRRLRESTEFRPRPASPNELLGPPRIGYKARRDQRKPLPGASAVTPIDLTEMDDLRPKEGPQDSPILVIDEQGYLQKREERREVLQPLQNNRDQLESLAPIEDPPAGTASPTKPAIPAAPELDETEALEQLEQISMMLHSSQRGLKPEADPAITIAPEPLLQKLDSRSSGRSRPQGDANAVERESNEKRSKPSETSRLFAQYLDLNAIPSPMTSASNRPPIAGASLAPAAQPTDRSRFINMGGIEDLRVKLTEEILATANAARLAERGSTSSKRKRLREREERVRASRQAHHSSDLPEPISTNARSIGSRNVPQNDTQVETRHLDSHDTDLAPTSSQMASLQQIPKKRRLGTRGIGQDKTTEAFAPFKPLTQPPQPSQPSQAIKVATSSQSTLTANPEPASVQLAHGPKPQSQLRQDEPVAAIPPRRAPRALSQEYNRTFAILQEQYRLRQQKQGQVLYLASSTSP